MSQVFYNSRPMNMDTNMNFHLPLKLMYEEERRKQRERMDEIEKLKRMREDKAIGKRNMRK